MLKFLTAASALALSSASAQPLMEDRKGTLTVLIENDSMVREDENFSSGVALSYMSGVYEPAGLSAWLRDAIVRPEGEAVARRGFSINHALYTPDDITVEARQPSQHPWAALLFAEATWAIQQPNRLDRLTLELGVIGEAAGGEPVQKFVHRAWSTDIPQGWDNQIDDEPLVNLHYDLQRRFWRTEALGQPFDTVASGTLSLGTRYTGLGAGARFRWGPGIDQSFGPVRIRPGVTGAGFFAEKKGFTWHGFIGGEFRAVAHNIVLDNSLFREERPGNPSVSTKPVVGDYQAGGVLQNGPWSMSLSVIGRSPQFEEEEDTQVFGSLAVSRKF